VGEPLLGDAADEQFVAFVVKLGQMAREDALKLLRDETPDRESLAKFGQLLDLFATRFNPDDAILAGRMPEHIMRLELTTDRLRDIMANLRWLSAQLGGGTEP
jgi:hypothetical protein